MTYPELVWYEEVPQREGIDFIYKTLTGYKFKNYFIRWCKIGIVLDDMSGSKLFTNTVENKLFMFL